MAISMGVRVQRHTPRWLRGCGRTGTSLLCFLIGEEGGTGNEQSDSHELERIALLELVSVSFRRSCDSGFGAIGGRECRM